MSRAKPNIIVMSPDTDKSFRWLSDGWYSEDNRNTKEAYELISKATGCIAVGSDVKDVIRRLKEAGFKITRVEQLWGDMRIVVCFGNDL